MSNRNRYSDSEPIQKNRYGEDNENEQIDSGAIIQELKRVGSHFKDLDDYLEEFEEEDYR